MTASLLPEPLPGHTDGGTRTTKEEFQDEEQTITLHAHGKRPPRWLKQRSSVFFVNLTCSYAFFVVSADNSQSRNVRKLMTVAGHLSILRGMCCNQVVDGFLFTYTTSTRSYQSSHLLSRAVLELPRTMVRALFHDFKSVVRLT